MLKKIGLCVYLVSCALGLSGCFALVAGVAGGAGTAVWLSGKLTQEVNKPYGRTVDAVQDALKSMGLAITKETKEDRIAQIMSNYTDGKTIWVDVRLVSEKVSRVDVRVGASGDKEAEQKIMDKIVERTSGF